MARGEFTTVGADEDVMLAFEYRVGQRQIRELQRLLVKKMLESSFVREGVERITALKKLHWRVTLWPGDGL